MTRTSVLPPEAAAYLDELREQLADLPAEERNDLLEEVEASLIEAAEEGEAAVPSRLGSPSRFAAELRTAAGLSTTPLVVPERGAGARFLAAARDLRTDPRIAAVLRVLHELAPLWWLARAYVAGAALALAGGGAWSIRHPSLPHVGGSAALGAAVLLALAAGSVWLGMRGRRAFAGGGDRGRDRVRGARLIVALNLALAIVAVPVVLHLVNRPLPVRYFFELQQSEPSAELTYEGARVENIYPYGRDGRLLRDVRLYDSTGEAIKVSGPAVRDPLRRLLSTSSGSPIFNSFPIRYFEPHTRTVAHPDAAPRPRVGGVVTPALPGGAAAAQP